MTNSPDTPNNDWTDPDHSGHTDDQWHRHTGEEAPQQAHGSTATWSIFVVGIVGFLFVVGSIFSISVYFKMSSQREIAAKQEVSMDADFKGAQAEWADTLSGYGWADGPKGLVRIPLSVAKTKTIEAYAQEQ